MSTDIIIDGHKFINDDTGVAGIEHGSGLGATNEGWGGISREGWLG